MADARSRPVDVGRVAVVVLFALSMVSAGGKAWFTATSGLPVRQTAPQFASCLLSAAFCALVVAAYLRRRDARATDGSPGVWLAAPLGTCLPLVIPVLPATPAGSGRS